jgi:transcriptional regulator with XRE-family HTH domain
MVYYRLGDVIRELRERLHLTQEELADGICSVSSVAKIEGGSQMPSGRVAEALLRRLKDSGCFFTGFSRAEELEELRSWERVLASARRRRGKGSLFEEQFYSYVRIVERMNSGGDHAVLLLELMETLVMSMPLDELYSETGRRRTYTYLELYILNSIAVQFYYMESLDAADRVLERACRYLLEWQMDGDGGRNLFPAVCNNLAAVRLAAGSVGSARELCTLGISRCLNAGLLLPLPSLYGNLSNVLAAQHDTANAQQAYSRMRLLQEMLSEQEPVPMSVESEFMRSSYLMSYVY